MRAPCVYYDKLTIEEQQVYISCYCLFHCFVLSFLFPYIAEKSYTKTCIKHKTSLIKCFWSFCSKPLSLETPITRSNFNFPWQFELSGLNFIGKTERGHVAECFCQIRRPSVRKRFSVFCLIINSNCFKVIRALVN